MQRLLIILGQPFTFILKTIFIVALFFIKLIDRLHFHRKPKKTRSSIRLPALFLTMIFIINFTIIIYNWWQKLPQPSALNNPPSLTTSILDRNGNLLYQIYRDENRTLVIASAAKQSSDLR